MSIKYLVFYHASQCFHFQKIKRQPIIFPIDVYTDPNSSQSSYPSTLYQKLFNSALYLFTYPSTYVLAFVTTNTYDIWSVQAFQCATFHHIMVVISYFFYYILIGLYTQLFSSTTQKYLTFWLYNFQDFQVFHLLR